MRTGYFDAVIVSALGIFEYAGVNYRFGILAVDDGHFDVLGRDPFYFLLDVDLADYFRLYGLVFD